MTRGDTRVGQSFPPQRHGVEAWVGRCGGEGHGGIHTAVEHLLVDVRRVEVLNDEVYVGPVAAQRLAHVGRQAGGDGGEHGTQDDAPAPAVAHILRAVDRPGELVQHLLRPARDGLARQRRRDSLRVAHE